MTKEQLEVLEKYHDNWLKYVKSQVIEIPHEGLLALQKVRMELRKETTLIHCGTCLKEMLNNLYQHEYDPYVKRLADETLTKQLSDKKVLSATKPHKRKK